MKRNKFHYYDGKIYECLIDPVLSEIRKTVVNLIPPGSSVIDIGCGTGAQVFELAKHCRFVTGVELSSKMISHALKRLNSEMFTNVELIHSNALTLPVEKSRTYDYAVISMMLHEIQLKYRLDILKEAERRAKKLIIADYSSPLPYNRHGIIAFMAEIMAGIEHFSGFWSYQKNH